MTLEQEFLESRAAGRVVGDAYLPLLREQLQAGRRVPVIAVHADCIGARLIVVAVVRHQVADLLGVKLPRAVDARSEPLATNVGRLMNALLAQCRLQALLFSLHQSCGYPRLFLLKLFDRCRCFPWFLNL